MKVVFTDGVSAWDNNQSKDYQVSMHLTPEAMANKYSHALFYTVPEVGAVEGGAASPPLPRIGIASLHPGECMCVCMLWSFAIAEAQAWENVDDIYEQVKELGRLGKQGRDFSALRI